MVQNSESEELYIVRKYGVRSGHYFIWLKVTFYMCSHLTLCKRIHEILPYFLHCTSDKSFQNVCLWASSAGWYKTLVQFQLNRIALIFTPEKSLRWEWGGWAKNANNIWQSYTLSPQDRRQLEAKKRIAVPLFQYFWRFRGKNTGFLSNVPILATPYFISKMIVNTKSMGYAFPSINIYSETMCFEINMNMLYEMEEALCEKGKRIPDYHP